MLRHQAFAALLLLCMTSAVAFGETLSGKDKQLFLQYSYEKAESMRELYGISSTCMSQPQEGFSQTEMIKGADGLNASSIGQTVLRWKMGYVKGVTVNCDTRDAKDHYDAAAVRLRNSIEGQLAILKKRKE
jgi:hypothetical protein